MKSILAAAVFSVFGSFAQADGRPAVISFLNCGSVGAISTSVVFTGNLAGVAYFNITTLSFGVPFTQQAKVISSRFTNNGLSFKLQTMITNQIAYLRIVSGTNTGSIASSDVDGDGIQLSCTAKIDVL